MIGIHPTHVKILFFVPHSDKTLAALSKHIQHELLPAQDEDDEEGCKEIQAALPIEIIEKAVHGIATRVNYGLDISKIPNAPLGGKIPVAWQVWRWELKDEYREWLPKSSRDKASVRLFERRQVSPNIEVVL
jgi:chromatin assembly factor 1 subunit A